MANGIITLNSTRAVLEGRVVWESVSHGPVANNSYVAGHLQVRRNDGYSTKGTWTGAMNIGGVVNTFSKASTSVGSDWVTMLEFYVDPVAHNSDGSGSCYIEAYCNGPSGTSMAGESVSGSQWVGLDKIPRYANLTSYSVKSRTIDTITLQFSADSTLDWAQYMEEGYGWADLPNDCTIRNLSPNTTYKIKIRVRRADSQLWTESGYISASTHDIGKISILNNFEHGNDVKLTITNPSGSSLSLAMKVGETQILTRNVSIGENTIIFSEEELDNLYKIYGSSDKLTAIFVLTTANKYTNQRSCVITLTGKQKTSYVEVDGQIKRAEVFIEVNGQIKRAITFFSKNKVPKRCI